MNASFNQRAAKKILLAVLLGGLLGLPGTAGGQPPEELKRLRLHAAAEPRAPLEYRLLPEFLDRRPGNAAVIYNKIALRYGELESGNEEQFKQWAETPLAELPVEKIRQTLADYQDILNDLERAALCDDCDWELGLRERGLARMNLVELQRVRSFSLLLAVRARLQMVEGDLTGAIRTLQTGLAMGRHVAGGPTLVNGLCAIGVCTPMFDQAEDLVGQPGAPNLYWALTALPQPMIDNRRGADTELRAPYLYIPELRHVENPTRSGQYWNELYHRLAAQVFEWGGREMPPWQSRLAAAALAVRGYPMAKRGLAERGWPAEQVDAMPAAQVLLIHTMRTYDELAQMSWKWAYVSYLEGQKRFSWNRFDNEARRQEVLPMAQRLVTGGSYVTLHLARCEERIALLRIIEALRLYAADTGRLPAKLDDVTQVPIPSDPITGEPFRYELHEDMAVLERPDYPIPYPIERRYEITLAR